MPSPFPGMDPYLEHPALWPGIHNWLIAALAEHLSPRLLPRYYVALEERLYIAAPPAPGPDFAGVPDIAVVAAGSGVRPDAAAEPARAPAATPTGSGVRVLTAAVPVPERVRETYLEIREPRGGDVVTVIEILSPSNKRPGEGWREYQEKRMRTLRTLTHLVEIDLLRGGEPPPIYPRDWSPNSRLPGDYRILIARGGRRSAADLYAFTVRDPVPPSPLPLREGDEEPLVDVQTVLHTLYDRAGYNLRIDYRGEPVPPLSAEDAAWATDLLRARGLR